MWDINVTQATDPSGFTELCAEYTQYYKDHMQQFQAMEKIVRSLFARVHLDSALTIAQPSSMHGSLFINLLWRPIYPYTPADERYDAEEQYNHNHRYGAELLINSNGINDDYTFIVCFNYRDADNALTSGKKAIPMAEHEDIVMPDWFESNVRKITGDHVKQMTKAKAAVRETIKEKIKAAFGFV